jgi:hypothetical protein
MDITTDTAAVAALGARIAGMASGLDGAIAGVRRRGVCEPAATAEALAGFVEAYHDVVRRLRDDVVALGGLTRAAGSHYDAVESAAARLALGGSALTGGVPGG